MNLETEVPEILFQGMKEFIESNPSWDQCSLTSSALTSFLVQNGSQDMELREMFLTNLFPLK